ncbi:hypothetical protein BN2475_450048 [Paraburkholderia ribeironis]|uniref:DUF72 domain-containing protein n=1 Tax=Paraburkholderia ribeironis TaxID=1247936 RepID=A0A1N7S9X7_9BURK|nr:hypothetical protein BN2475_450048 [Paraburkholderia ribeironis]
MPQSAARVRSHMSMKQSGDVRIGISGWRYEGWRNSFYPAGLKQTEELQYASSSCVISKQRGHTACCTDR